MMSVRQGPVRFLKVVPTPLTGRPRKQIRESDLVNYCHQGLYGSTNVLEFETKLIHVFLNILEFMAVFLNVLELMAVSLNVLELMAVFLNVLELMAVFLNVI